MKKEIMALIHGNGGNYALNNICYLSYSPKPDLIGFSESLAVYFYPVNDVDYGYSCVPIASRDYDGIMREVSAAIQSHLSEVANKLCRDLNAGYNSAHRPAPIYFSIFGSGSSGPESTKEDIK